MDTQTQLAKARQQAHEAVQYAAEDRQELAQTLQSAQAARLWMPRRPPSEGLRIGRPGIALVQIQPGRFWANREDMA